MFCFCFNHQFCSDQDSSRPLEQVVRDENGRTRRKAVFGDEGDWDQDNDTLYISADDEEKNGVGSDEGDEVSDNDDDDNDDAVEVFENNEDTGEGEVLRGKNMESFESDSDDDDDDDDNDNGDDDDSGESDNGDKEEEEEEEVVDEEIVFNLKPRKQSRKEKLPDKQTTPLKRTKRRVVHDESEGDSEQGESDDDEVEFEEKENDDVNRNSGDDSNSDSEVQLARKGKRKIRHDVIVERGDEQRVKKKFRKETNSLGHTRKSVEDSLSSQEKSSIPKKAKGAGSERIEEAFLKSSKTKPKATKGIFDEKKLSEAGGDSDENEVDMESLDDDEDDAESDEEDDTTLEDSSLGLEEEGIISLGLAKSER